MQTISVDTVQETLMLPFGLYFRQVLAGPSPFPGMAQTTSEPETTHDENDPEKFDVDWIPDEDEEDDDGDDDE